MSRYIDTKWLEDNAKEYSLGYYEEDEWATPLSALDDAPSIDICFCRECKHYKDEWCYWRDVEIRADDFCSYGSRSEKPNNSTTEDCSMVAVVKPYTPTNREILDALEKSDCPWK